MSIFVISLVVWLVIVFLSVTSGIEKNWLQKLITLHAPVRISPTEEYYRSYYYQIDSFCASSDYTLKTIGEKAQSSLADPYSETEDIELPLHFPPKEKIDPVLHAFQVLESFHLPFQDYELSGALLKVQRGSGAIVSQMSYLLSYPDQNPNFSSLIIPSKDEDFSPDPTKTPILLPKSYQESGVRVGDIGFFSYPSSTSFSSQEQKIPIQVKGFYDPGLVSVGSKCIMAPMETVRQIHHATQTFSPDGTPTNGIFVWCKDLKLAHLLKKEIEEGFEKAGILKYWKVETYRDFSFSKDLMLQFQSDRTLFLLIATIILIVACCNIISLLVLLVNEKKKEIAILQSMGTRPSSVALIFGLVGALMGTFSCLFGSLLAIFTLKKLDYLVAFLNFLQGHQAFNPSFFGPSLPNQLSQEALLFVLILTPLLSFIAGLIPALKASTIHPSQTLKSG